MQYILVLGQETYVGGLKHKGTTVMDRTVLYFSIRLELSASPNISISFSKPEAIHVIQSSDHVVQSLSKEACLKDSVHIFLPRSS